MRFLLELLDKYRWKQDITANLQDVENDQRDHYEGEQQEDGRAVAWASSVFGVHKLLYDADGFRCLGTLRIKPSKNAGGLSGAYSLIDKDGVFFVPRGSTLYGFTSTDPKNLESSIRMSEELSLPLASDDAIVGLNMTYDGYLVYVSKKGVVGAVSRDFKRKWALH